MKYLKNKNIYKCSLLFGASLVLGLLGACSDFLDESDPSNFTVENYFTKPEHARSSVNAIYASLSPTMNSGFNGGSWMMTEFATGLAGTDLGQAVDSYYVKDLRNTSDNSYGLAYWGDYYRGIGNANLSIQKIPGIVMDEQEKKLLLGEAYFMRAFYYFHLVRMFGNIPLVTEPINLQSEQLKPIPSDAQAVYELIISDLKTAEEAGLPLADQSGKVTLGAVKSLLAKVYLTMAGYPLQLGTSYFQLAADKAQEVISSGAYSLFTSYGDLHDPRKKNGQENIFSIQFKTQVLPSNWQVAIIPYNKNISKYSDETGGIYATKDFVDSYEAGDLRAEEKQFFFTQFTHESDRSKTVDLGGYFLYKHFDTDAQVNSANSDLNWPLLRYADVLLMYAEAANEVTGPSTDVYSALNTIRARAKLAPAGGLSKDQLRELIWKERWHELCFENITWFDMVRLRKAFNVKTNKFEDFVGHKFSYGPVLTERELLFPIPTSEVRNNENLKQNIGY
ncbi:MAG: RagB/SusD family nutrient uptake outer membrane protein [Sphingobacterium sp.]|uniref:RagB/SusD family nutrient uptake outer membrane protein n=1 Tax=Sphingobacterium sp. JB170 TaxID=1434842 RepID=UPI00097F03F0|nr:RagB/SusD family nutrient uptake outer membrane protein [Sphingobacterium sp. JB170]SJN20511.1 SusD, outer membrane protein [Sphingobacterium sp. JB170]